MSMLVSTDMLVGSIRMKEVSFNFPRSFPFRLGARATSGHCAFTGLYDLGTHQFNIVAATAQILKRLVFGWYGTIH